MLLSEFIQSIRDQVLEGCSHLTNDRIAQYVRSAMCLINLLAQQQLTTTQSLKLCVGSIHRVKDCKVVKVIGQTDKEGNLLEEFPDLTEEETRFTAQLSKSGFPERCVSEPTSVCNSYRITSADIEGNGSTIIVRPPVPVDQDIYLFIECAGSLKLIEPGKDGEIPCEWEEAITQWVLFKIEFPLATDEYTFPRANTHAKLFAELLQISLDSLIAASNDEDN